MMNIHVPSASVFSPPALTRSYFHSGGGNQPDQPPRVDRKKKEPGLGGGPRRDTGVDRPVEKPRSVPHDISEGPQSDGGNDALFGGTTQFMAALWYQAVLKASIHPWSLRGIFAIDPDSLERSRGNEPRQPWEDSNRTPETPPQPTRREQPPLPDEPGYNRGSSGRWGDRLEDLGIYGG